MVRTFRRTWSDYISGKPGRQGELPFADDGTPRGRPPVVRIKVTTFVGHRLALHVGKPELACQWITRDHNQSFECHNGAKRGPSRRYRRSVVMGPRQGDDRQWSATYTPGNPIATADLWEDERMWFEAMPDPIELSPPHVDA